MNYWINERPRKKERKREREKERDREREKQIKKERVGFDLVRDTRSSLLLFSPLALAIIKMFFGTFVVIPIEQWSWCRWEKGRFKFTYSLSN